MTIELKTEWFGARFGKTKANAIRRYSIKIGMRPTDLVRTAIEEYMVAHPVSSGGKNE